MKFVQAFMAFLLGALGYVSCWRLKLADNLSNNDFLADAHLNFGNIRFKESISNIGPWDKIMNSISSAGEGIKNKANDLKNNAINAAGNLADDINCLLGKCKNKEQESNLNKESENLMIKSDIDSKQLINDPNVKLDIPEDKKDSNENMNIKESGGAGTAIKKRQVQDQVDSRFVILRPYDGIINGDNSVRFYAMDTTTKESLIMKLFFKGDAKEGKFYTESSDPAFKDSIEDCKDSKIITNRIFNKPITFTDPIIEGQDEPVYPNFEMTRCIAGAGSSGAKTAFYSIYSIPIGEKLSTKCLHDLDLSKDNSCIHYLKLISNGLLNGIKLLNNGKTFYKHGNVRPNNIYLYIKNDTQKVFLDNMIYDKNIYDDINDKPFKFDFNMLGETLLQLLSGTSKTENVILKIPDSTFQIYYQIKRYFAKYSIDVNLKIAALNVGEGIFDYLGKCVTRAEYEYKLQKSIFNFIYRLKCSGTNPTDQFMDIDQALNHDFIKSLTRKGNNSNEKWDVNPADY